MGGNRKLGSITLGLVLLLALFAAGCGGSTTTSAALATSESTPAASDTTVTTETTATTAASADYKVAVVSPPFSASEDEYRGGQTVKKKYGDMIVHLVLPDDFTGEQETVLSQITSLGDDPQVKAIVIAAGYTGILPALIKVKESRPDIKIITAPIWDDPDQMAKYVDLALDTDAIKRGVNIVQKAKEMGATTLIHYSFPSHMQKELLAQRRDTMEAEAEKNLWTADEKEQYKYQLLKTLNLEEYVPFHISFENYGPSMHMAPFDKMVWLWMGKKKYEPVDYDKRFNFKLQGQRDGMIWFPRYDEKTGKSLVEGVNSVRLELHSSISPFLSARQTISFIWDIAKDNPGRLYEGKAASRLELDRLIKRIDKLNTEKRELEEKLNELNTELSTINTRVEELQKQ